MTKFWNTYGKLISGVVTALVTGGAVYYGNALWYSALVAALGGVGIYYAPKK